MLTAITNQMVHLIDAATNTTAGVGFITTFQLLPGGEIVDKRVDKVYQSEN
jgi:hypothetical protein